MSFIKEHGEIMDNMLINFANRYMYNPYIVESKKTDYVIYHNQYSSAINEILAFASANGYETNEDDIFNQISTGPRKPSDGQTNKFHLDLYKNGELQKKKLHAQVYGMNGKYELNMYIL